MYNRYFGLKERPFKLVPNPAYLYLSRSHAEALGHLNYAVQDGDGFAAITGEAGTGKTTICRMFLENLDEQVEAAYVFNPKLDSLQLLKSINTEFGLPADADNVKDLIDTLNNYLLQKKAEKKHVILLIDEAQNLSKDVLEQLRLLSNLEMNAAKLIQIILVGQPELADLLDSYELRQLAQRITLRCNLLPLSLKETREYIRHRLGIASHGTLIRFTRPAYRAIHGFSRGIPRLINVVCDRALLFAYSENKRTINLGVARAAVAELRGHGRPAASAGWKSPFVLSGLGILVLVMILFFQGFSGSSLRFPWLNQDRPAAVAPISISTGNESDLDTVPAIKVAAVPPARVVQRVEMESLPGENRSTELKTFLPTLDRRASRNTALAAAVRCWHGFVEMNQRLNAMENDLEFFRLAAGRSGLKMVRIEANLPILGRINLPAILELYPDGAQHPCYLLLTGVNQQHLTFQAGEGPIVTDAEELGPWWKGTAVILYKDFYNYAGTIPGTAPKEAVLTLKMHLNEIGFKHIEMNPVYDAATRQVITMLQVQNGLRADGVVGPLTTIILYNAVTSLDIPHLQEVGERG